MSDQRRRQLSFDFVPREPKPDKSKKPLAGGDAERLARGVQAQLKDILKSEAVWVDEPGNIEPDSKSSDTAKRIAARTNPVLIERAEEHVNVRLSVSSEDEVGRRTEAVAEISRVRKKTRVDAQVLSRMIQRVCGVVDDAVGLGREALGMAVKVGRWFASVTQIKAPKSAETPKSSEVAPGDKSP